MLFQEPNVYAVWIKFIEVFGEVIKILAVPAAAAIGYYLNKKLNSIHTLVNGNLHAANMKVDELRAKMTQAGLDPDA
jgi:hypothetical protein